VFQDARLFEHLSVAGNLKFAVQRAAETNGSISLDDVVDALDIGSIMDRDVLDLSGGERQRVAIGRTLLTQPSLLLLDEPLAALDVGRKGEILPYLEALPQNFGIPAIYVSHAVNEMARLADRVVVLEAGRIVANGPAHSILGREDLQLSSVPFEAITILDVQVDAHLTELGLTRVRHRDQSLVIPLVAELVAGDRARVAIRAGDVVLATTEPAGISVRNVLRGILCGIEPIADSAFASVSVDVGGVRLKARLTRHAIAELELATGMEVYALVKTAAFDRSL
jgi:molybdate transport system ATP-binding protein